MAILKWHPRIAQDRWVMQLLQKILPWFVLVALSVLLITTLLGTPQSIDQLVQQGTSAQLDGNYAKAESTWWQVVQRDPKREDAYVGLGDALLAQERYSEAVLAFQQVSRLKPDHAWRYAVKLGDALAGAGQLNNAIAAYEKALRGRDPDFPDLLVKSMHAKAHLGLGNVLRQQGQFKAAAAEYLRALTLDPKLTAAQQQLKELGVLPSPSPRSPTVTPTPPPALSPSSHL